MSRRRHTDKEKARIIREFGNHYGSTADFCRRHKIFCQTFTNWRRRAEASLPIREEPTEFLEFELGATCDPPAPAASGPAPSARGTGGS